MDWLHKAQTKSYQTEPDEKAAGSIWLPGPEICRKLEGSWPQTAPELHFVYKRRRNMVLSNSIWPINAQDQTI